MEPEQIKQKIVAETTALMTLKIDNELVVKDKFRMIRDQVETLLGSLPYENELYRKAFDLVETTMGKEYKQFSDSILRDEKEQALIELRHKAAEVCELIRAV